MDEENKYKLTIEKGYNYNSKTGDITGPKGNIIKYKSKAGYLIIRPYLNGKYYNIYSHRFAWYYTYHAIPNKIDHINRIKHDNTIINLRSVTHQENQWNRGNKGYSWKKSHNKYEVKIKVNNKHIFIGNFNTEEEAKLAYLKAKDKYHKIKYHE